MEIYDGWVLGTDILPDIQKAADTGKPLHITTGESWGLVAGQKDAKEGTWANTVGPIIAVEALIWLKTGKLLPIW